jgi:protein-S-isoprenylcysteine O-methyltransferase Ste14
MYRSSLHHIFRACEEQRLEQVFGKPYRDYLGRVRRWI